MSKHKGIFQRGNIFWIRYTGIDGKQIRESVQSDKLKDAQDLLKLRQAAVVKGEESETIKIKSYTFKELAKEYLDFCVGQRGYVDKGYRIEQMKREFNNLPLRNFSTMLLEKYQSKMLSSGLAESTVNRQFACLKHMFTKAFDWHMVNESTLKAIHRVKPFKTCNRRERYLSNEEIKNLLDACDMGTQQKHLKPLILFALNTGCRREEIFSLTWDQVNLKSGFIYLSGMNTKNKESRQIPINDTLRSVLQGLIRRVDVPWIFYDPATGQRFNSIKRSFATACKKAGIGDDFVFHCLRHTFASHLVMAGVDITTVSRLLGHKSLTMTLRYSHLAPNHLTTAVNVLNASMPISTVLAQNEKKGLRIAAQPLDFHGGRYWDRTSGPCRVKTIPSPPNEQQHYLHHTPRTNNLLIFQMT